MRTLFLTLVVATTTAMPAFAQQATRSSWAEYIEGYIREFPHLVGM